MNDDLRRRLEQYVKPLYAGLDGVQTFDRVDRLRGHLAALRADPAGQSAALDEALLELLLLFHGVVDRLGSLAAGGRLDLFLRSLGLPEEMTRAVRAGLGRLEAEPRGPEEELLHDALLLEAAGVIPAVERLMAAGKKRVALARALAQLDPGPAAERYTTPRGAALGAARRREAEAWIEDLRHRAAQEASGQLIGSRPESPSS
jgi:hypothetical protein